VGANLQDHLQIRTVFKVTNVKTLNTQASSLWASHDRPGVRAQAQRPDEHGASQLGAFTRSDAASLTQHRVPRAALSLDAFVNRCTASTPSPPVSATCSPAAAARCRSRARALTPRPQSRRTT